MDRCEPKRQLCRDSLLTQRIFISHHHVSAAENRSPSIVWILRQPPKLLSTTWPHLDFPSSTRNSSSPSGHQTYRLASARAPSRPLPNEIVNSIMGGDNGKSHSPSDMDQQQKHLSLPNSLPRP